MEGNVQMTQPTPQSTLPKPTAAMPAQVVDTSKKPGSSAKMPRDTPSAISCQGVSTTKKRGRKAKLGPEELEEVKKYIVKNAKTLQQQLNAGKGRDLLLREAIKNNGILRKCSEYQWKKCLAEIGLRPKRTGDEMRYISGRTVTDLMYQAATKHSKDSADPASLLRVIVRALTALENNQASLVANELRKMAKQHGISLKSPQPVEKDDNTGFLHWIFNLFKIRGISKRQNT